MLILEYKARTNQHQRAAIDEAIRTTQFIRNKALRLWMDTRGTNAYDLNQYSAQLAKDFPFASRLNSMARQAAAERAWQSIDRFYKNCREQKPGKKGYPRFQKDNRSVEYKTSGWKLEPDGKRLHRRKDRKHKGSANRKKAIKRLAKGYLRVSRQRKDFACKQASALVISRDMIAYENLQIANLVKNHHLAKSISDASWGLFLGWVRYYGGLHGIPIVAVPPKFTTQDCSGTLPDGSPCKTRVQKSLSVRTHVCPRCGVVLDRDENAALNILDAARCTVGQTETGSRTAAKRLGKGGPLPAARRTGKLASVNQESPPL